MYIISLSEKLILNKIISHIILIIQITVSLFLIESVASTVSLLTQTTDYMKPLLNSNYCYYSITERRYSFSDTGEMVDNNSGIYFEDILKGLSAVAQNEYVNLNIETKTSSSLLQSYRFLQKTNTSFKKGKTFDEENAEKGIIRLLTNDPSFRTNSIYDAQITDLNGNIFPVKIKVTGILNNPSYVMEVTSAGSEMCSANIVHTVDEYKKNEQFFFSIICIEDYEQVTGAKLKHTISDKAMLLFDDDISTVDMNNNIELLKKTGAVATADDIKSENKAENLYLLRNNLPSFVFLFMVAITGMYAISSININEQMNTLSLYGILGCSAKDISKIIITYILMICSIPCLIVWMILAASQTFGFLSDFLLCINIYNYLIPLVMCLFMVLTVPITPKRTFFNGTLNNIRLQN